MITIAVDAMGGDDAPRPEVEGSILAAREWGLRVLLVGQPADLRRELARHAHRGLQIEIVPASEVIAMTDSPAQAFRKKKDSSAHVAAHLVETRKGRRLVQRRQYRRGDDRGAVRPGHAAVGAAAGAGSAVAHQSRRRGGAAGRRSQRGFQGGPSCAIRGDGGDLLPHNFRHAASRAWPCCPSAKRPARGTS